MSRCVSPIEILPFSSSMSEDAIPQWLHDLHTHAHIVDVISVLAKRERARDAARARSRRRASGSTKARVGGALVDALGGSLPSDARIDHYSVAVGSAPEHKAANRYLQLEPYDRTRVVVGEGGAGELSEGGSGGRYLNANWVRERAGGRWWVATQAPLPNTAHAFLSLLCQPIAHPDPAPAQGAPSRIRTIVQLTPNVEKGLQKAHIYFPGEIGQAWHLQPEPGHSAPDLEVTLRSTQSHPEAQCVQSTVEIRPAGAPAGATPVVFNHLLYGAWPDHGVPALEERAGLLQFAHLVHAANHAPGPDPDPPIVVGCSAGIGRTGAFVSLCSLLRAHGLLPGKVEPPPPELPEPPLGPLPPHLVADPIAAEIDALREQRPGMVQREDQILLIYEVLALAFTQAAHAA